MKSEKGVTLTALVTYIVIFIIIIGIVSTISAHFYKSVGQMNQAPEYIEEFNKFSMFFIRDVKKNNNITSISSTEVQFEDGTRYLYSNGNIYRNDTKIAKYVKRFSFTGSDYTVNSITKKIIHVKAEFGKSDETITKDIDFVLKYW